MKRYIKQRAYSMISFIGFGFVLCAAGCGQESAGAGNVPAGASVVAGAARPGSFDNPPLGDPLSSNAADLKGVEPVKKARRAR